MYFHSYQSQVQRLLLQLWQYLFINFFLPISFCSDKLRASRTAVSEADVANEYSLGVPGEVFAFSQCQNKVTVAEASGLTSEISQLEQFVREHVKA